MNFTDFLHFGPEFHLQPPQYNGYHNACAATLLHASNKRKSILLERVEAFLDGVELLQDLFPCDVAPF